MIFDAAPPFYRLDLVTSRLTKNATWAPGTGASGKCAFTARELSTMVCGASAGKEAVDW